MIGKQVKVLENKQCRVAFIHRTSQSSGTESMLRASGDQIMKEGDRLMLFAKVGDIEDVEKRLTGS
jgi:Trk K+ transport system NAD-binding subunit